MKFFVVDPSKQRNITMLLRGAGYHHEVNRRTGAASFVRSLSGDFPRFHIYLNEFPDGWEINLHLDQKRPTYGGSHAHSGEYDGEVVEQETARLKQFLRA